MALDQSALLELLGELKLTDTTDRIRAATERLYRELIDAATTAFIGAAPFERSAERQAIRNGSRPRTLSTTAGNLELRIPKLRQGSFFPSLLERRRRVDQALLAIGVAADGRRRDPGRRPAPPGRHRPRRAARRMGSRRPPLLLRNLDGRKDRDRHHDRRGGDTPEITA